MAILDLDDVKVPREVDTGAAVSLMSARTQQRVFPGII